MARWSKLYQVAIWICCLGSFTLSGRLVAITVEEGGFVLTGDDPEALLAVRYLVRASDQKWRSLGVASQAIARTLPVEIRVDGEGAAFDWSADLSEGTAVKRIAHHWLGMRLGVQSAQEKIGTHAWVLDWMTGTFLSERSPTGKALWIARAGEVPMPLGRLLDSDAESTTVLEFQRWLLGEWWYHTGGKVELGGHGSSLLEADWAAFFFAQKAAEGGPFMSMAESARRIETVGQLTLVQTGLEARVWLHEVPTVVPVETKAHRLAQLRLLRERIHPVYHRALLALIGAAESGDGNSFFSLSFAQAWAEAEDTASEIRAGLNANLR